MLNKSHSLPGVHTYFHPSRVATPRNGVFTQSKKLLGAVHSSRLPWLTFEKDIAEGSSGDGKVGVDTIVGIRPLSPHCPKYLTPGSDEAMGCYGQIVLDRLSQFRKMIERNGCEHMVFHMIIHIPIDKPDEPSGEIGTRILPPIGNVTSHTDVLRLMSEDSEPACAMWRQRYEEYENPVSRSQE